MKVVVVAFPDCGSTDMLAALKKLGIDNTYTGEDFRFFLWHPIATRYWLRRVGGDWHDLPYPGNPIKRDADYAFEVLKRTPDHVMAANISRCRPGALAMDGVAMAAHRIVRASPGVKIIRMRWRSLERSVKLQKRAFFDKMTWFLPFSIIFGAPSALPWGALVPVVDKHLGGGAAEQFVKSGRADFGVGKEPWTLTLFRGATYYSRVMAPDYHGVAYDFSNHGLYVKYMDLIGNVTREQDVFEIDFRIHTYEDVCKFLDVSPCPKSGKIPMGVGDVPTDWPAYVPFALLTLPLHWLNWKILGYLLAPMCSCCRKKAKDKVD